MNPQPPVTNMRIDGGTSSDDGGALANFPMLRDQLDAIKASLARTGWTPWLILALAAFLRLLLLGIKPPHFDEGINGWFVDAHIVKDGFYKYDPTNYHGPLHFYVLFLSETLLGRNLWALRLPVVLVSILCVWLCFKFEPFFGRTASRVAALAMAVSPGFVFYGRYSIHEAWLQLFSMMLILGILGLWKVGTVNYLWCTGMSIAGMILTKETYIIHIGCAALAFPVLMASKTITPLPDFRRVKQTWTYLDLAAVIAVGIVAIVFFYSGTFFHWSGVKGLYRAYEAWFTTGQEGHGHEKPWHYWVTKLMVRYEWPALIGLALCVFCQAFKNSTIRYLAIYGVGTLAAYSIVNYKTPWCIISIIWPLLFIFGAAFTLIPKKRQRPATVGAAILLIASLVASIRLNYFRCTTESEPYVYVQTFNDIRKFTDPLLKVARQDPANYHLAGSIIRGSSYPLPWILGDFSRIGYYEHNNLPGKVDADFLLVEESRVAEIEAKLRDNYYTDTLRIRAYQDSSKAYFRASVFKSIFPNRAPEFKGKAPANPPPPKT